MRRREPAPAWTLVAAIVGSSMSFIDGSAVNVALPVVQRDFGASAASTAWVVEGYALFLSALILIGGALGDRFGRRRIYFCGIALFALASIACGLAPNVRFLVIARCVQGVGGALAVPGSLALLSAAYAGAARGRAIGTWSGFSAITSAIGPVLGGWLVQVASWRLVFFINVPLAALVLAIVASRVRESSDATAPRRLDAAGAILATLGLGALVYGLLRLQGGLGDALGLGAAGAGVCALVAFGIVEARIRHPMISLALFRSRTFAVANAYTFALYATLGGGLYFIPFDLIDVQHYAPAAAGAALLPYVAIVFPLSRFSGALVVRIGPRRPLAAGAALVAVAFVAFARVGIGGPYWTTFFPGALLLGLGGAAFVAPLTTIVMDSVGTAHAGVGSGINNALARTAGLVAVAALGVVLAHGGAHGAANATATRTAFQSGFAATMLACAALAACACAIALAGFPPGVRPSAPAESSR